MMRLLATLFVVLLASACASDETTSPAEEQSGVPATIAVTSPIGTRLAIGRTAQLSAEARDATGRVVSGVTFAWTSSATSVASVTSSGVVTGAASGSATLTASTGSIQGAVTFQVSAADFTGIDAALDDPFSDALVANLTTGLRNGLQTALAACATAETAGDFAGIESCLANARTLIAGANDASDRAVLASLAFYVDHIERLLNR